MLKPFTTLVCADVSLSLGTSEQQRCKAEPFSFSFTPLLTLAHTYSPNTLTQYSYHKHPTALLPDPFTLFSHTKFSHFTNILKESQTPFVPQSQLWILFTISLWRRCNAPIRWRLLLSSFSSPVRVSNENISWNMRVRCKKSLAKLNSLG